MNQIMVDRKNSYIHHVIIIGGGFAGLYAAKILGNSPVQVTLIDKRNFHLFQPLLYQVATGGLSPGDVASPIRAVLNRYKNIWVMTAEVIDIDPNGQKVILRDGELTYDTLIVATGASHHYFGHDDWAQKAPGLKTVEDALEIRRRIFLAFEAAERETDPEMRRAWMRFVVVGGGPTGVELAGALGELACTTLKDDFRNINTSESEITLIEGLDRLLPTYPPDLSAKAREALSRLNVNVQTQTMVTDIKNGIVTTQSGNHIEQIKAQTILWAAGVKASSLGQMLAKETGAKLDRAGRVIVQSDFTLPNYPNIFVVGDLASYSHGDGTPLPGVASVAMQEGPYVANVIKGRLKGKTPPHFHYNNKGSLAVIGRNKAVADLGRLRFDGFIAWLIWVFVHISYLVEFDNKILVLFQWAWNYFTRKRSALLITGNDPFPTLEVHKKVGKTITIPQRKSA
ncbi:MAG: NAD(P)/FAD-dependent oxidoreductase [Ignavibacteriales bacterium]